MASDGKLDLTKAKPLMMTGLGKGMNFLHSSGHATLFEPFFGHVRERARPVGMEIRRLMIG